jgi:signal transduction histidine kinase/ActR/RegA family two-component response regulator
MNPTPNASTSGTKQEKPSQSEEGEQLRLANHYLRVALDQVKEGVVLLDAGPLDATGPRILYSNMPVACLTGVEPGRGLRGLYAVDLAGNERDAASILNALTLAADSGAAEFTALLQTRYEKGPRRCIWRVKALHNSMKQLLNFTLTLQPCAEDVPAAPTPPPAAKPDDLDGQSERLRVENLAAMAQGIAHDVNNLLGPITAQLSLVQPTVDPSSELGKALEMIMASVKRAKQFTGQVVKTAKSRPHEKCPTDLMCLVHETVRLAQAGTNVKVTVRAADDLPWAQCDGVKVSQVLQNLVMNGIQAMPKGGYLDVEAKEVEVRYGQDAELKPGRYLEVRVRDRGVGISPDNLARLFKQSFTTKMDGNGIGLTTCKRVVEDHEGVIRVDSALGVGTEFRFYLPSVAKPENAAPQGEQKPLSRGLTSGTGTVLIVDDECAIRAIASSILKRCGYRVLECESGEQAVRTYTHMARIGTPVDVLLMDLTLSGGMEGLETAQKIWALDPGAKIIVSSGSVTVDIQRSFLEQGFIAILPKPYEAGELSDAVLSAIRSQVQPFMAVAD